MTLISRTSDPTAGSALILSSPDDLPLAAHLTFTLKSRSDFPRNGRVEVETSDGTLRTVLTLAPSGGLVLQDPHTVVASLDPLRSFGPSAFGPLRLRAVFPALPSKTKRPLEGEAADADMSPTPVNPAPATIPTSSDDPTRQSNWQPLGTLVRLPTLTHLQCTSDVAAPCNLNGANLFLIQSISADPAFTTFSTVPDGFTGSTLPVPHPATAMGPLFVRLRDDPGAVDVASVPTSSTTTQASTAHNHGAAAHN